MLDLECILIPEIQITPHHSEARSKAWAPADCLSLDLNDELHVPPYLNYLVLTHLIHRLPIKWREDRLVFYNRYFWFVRFLRLYCKKHGQDAGLEQQTFQILETSTIEIDWQVIEAIDELTNKMVS